MPQRVTMRDVAREVGVSPMTVSRAFREDETVSAATRDAVRQTAARLGYVYDSTAIALRTQKSGFVAVTLPSINNANFAETYRELSAGMEGSGMQLLLGATNYRIEKEETLLRQLLTRKPEALVLTGGHHTPAVQDLLGGLDLPIVEMWDLPATPLDHSIGFSNADAMGLVVEHLAAQGRTRLAFVGASAGSDRRGADRREGAHAAARRLGLPEITVLDAGPAPVSMRQGATCVMQAGKALSAFDALVCVSDPVAFGALSACQRLGIEVPGDLAITGFGHFDLATVSMPRITTVDVGAGRIGAAVAQTLLAVFAGRPTARRVDVGARLVVGETS